MDWGVGFFYTALTVLALGAAFRFPERYCGVALVINVIGSNLALAWLPAPASFQPPVQLLFEFVSFEAAMICAVAYYPRELAVFTWLAMLSAFSMSFSTNQALHAYPFGGYQYVVNAILVAQCVTILRRGIADAGRRIYNVGRGWRHLRSNLDGVSMDHHGVAAVPPDGRTERAE